MYSYTIPKHSMTQYSVMQYSVIEYSVINTEATDTEAAKRSFSYRGAVLWNDLPDESKTKLTVLSFKAALL